MRMNDWRAFADRCGIDMLYPRHEFDTMPSLDCTRQQHTVHNAIVVVVYSNNVMVRFNVGVNIQVTHQVFATTS